MTKQDKLKKLKHHFSEIEKLGVEFYRIGIAFSKENLYFEKRSPKKKIDIDSFLENCFKKMKS